ncbi:MAG: flagellar motor switch protein FliM, partial [Deltaproteobacteria bacterium]|nr:flagellar motor switch protein FliM [Deltaproteobacteria bacterium]
VGSHMEQILTQEEIDALLKGLAEGAISVSQKEEKEKDLKREDSRLEVKRFDFRQQAKVRKEHFPALQFVFDRFCKSFQRSISVFVETEVETELKSIQYVRYDEFVKNLPLPTNMNILVSDELKGFFIVVLDAKTVFAILEIIFGSRSVTAPKVEGREFTKIELGVIKKILEIVASEMEKAWEPVYKISCRYSRSEMDPRYVMLVSQDETVCLCDLSFSVSDVVGWMKICIPYGILEGIKGYLVSTPLREDVDIRRTWLDSLVATLKEVPLDTRIILAKKKMTLKEFLDLKPGSFFFLDKHVDDPVTVEVGRKTKFIGRMGTYRGVKAVKIETIVR